MRSRTRTGLLLSLALVAACPSSRTPSMDAGPPADARAMDSASLDADARADARTPADAQADGGSEGGPRDAMPTGNCTTAADCDDGNVCNGLERCQEAGCVPGPALDCDDAVPCTVDRCDPSLGLCVHQPDSRLCLPAERCAASAGCVSRSCATDADCDDGSWCDGRERCVAGRCQPGARLDCDDHDDCTDTWCSESARRCARAPRDRDHDGYGDFVCGGIDCNDTDATIHPGLAELCGDGKDNDCDGFPDCGDVGGCIGDPSSGPVTCPGGCIPEPEGWGSPGNACHNGRDEDCNGLTDCADPSCFGSAGCPRAVCPESGLPSNVNPLRSDVPMVDAGDNSSGSCGGAGAVDFAFYFVAPLTGTFTFDTSGSGFPAVLYLLDGTSLDCGASELPGACATTAPSLPATLSVSLPAGAPVLVVVDGWNPGDASPGHLTITYPP